MKFYTFLLLVLVALLSMLLITRKDLDGTIMRTPGMLYQERGTDSISNLYNIKLVNKTANAIPLTLKLENFPGQLTVIGRKTIDVKEEGQGSGSFLSSCQLMLSKTGKRRSALVYTMEIKKLMKWKLIF